MSRNLSGLNALSIQKIQTDRIDISSTVDENRVLSLENQDILHTNDLNSHNTRLLAAESLLFNAFDQTSLLGDPLQTNKFTKTNILSLTADSACSFQDISCKNLTQDNATIIQSNNDINNIWNELQNTRVSNLEITNTLTLPALTFVGASVHTEDIMLNQDSSIQQQDTTEVNTFYASDFFKKIRVTTVEQIGAADVATFHNLVVNNTCTLPAFTSPTITTITNNITTIENNINDLQNEKANIDNPTFSNGLFVGNSNQLRLYTESTDIIAGRMDFTKLYLKTPDNNTMAIFDSTQTRIFNTLTCLGNFTSSTTDNLISDMTTVQNNKAEKSYVDSQDTNLQNQITTNSNDITVLQNNKANINAPVFTGSGSSFRDGCFFGSQNQLRIHESGGTPGEINFTCNKTTFRSTNGVVFCIKDEQKTRFWQDLYILQNHKLFVEDIEIYKDNNILKVSSGIKISTGDLSLGGGSVSVVGHIACTGDLTIPDGRSYYIGTDPADRLRFHLAGSDGYIDFNPNRYINFRSGGNVFRLNKTSSQFLCNLDVVGLLTGQTITDLQNQINQNKNETDALRVSMNTLGGSTGGGGGGNFTSGWFELNESYQPTTNGVGFDIPNEIKESDWVQFIAGSVPHVFTFTLPNRDYSDFKISAVFRTPTTSATPVDDEMIYPLKLNESNDGTVSTSLTYKYNKISGVLTLYVLPGSSSVYRGFIYDDHFVTFADASNNTVRTQTGFVSRWMSEVWLKIKVDG